VELSAETAGPTAIQSTTLKLEDNVTDTSRRAFLGQLGAAAMAIPGWNSLSPTLAPGVNADVAVLDLAQGTFEMRDAHRRP